MSLTADLAEFIAGHRREVYRNDWTGLTEPRVGGGGAGTASGSSAGFGQRRSSPGTA